MNVENEALRHYLLPKQILIIEDDPEVCRMLAAWSERMNCHLTFATNGQDGLLKALARDWHFVLIDIGLPVIDGFEIIQRIRRNKPDFVRFAAVSGWWSTERVDRLKQMGCFIFITKPADFTGQFFENLWVMLGVTHRETAHHPPITPSKL